jgi:phenylacetate-CoA ligase
MIGLSDIRLERSDMMNTDDKRQKSLAAYSAFLSTPIEQRLQQALSQDAVADVLALFQEVAANVPAYQQFLADHGISPEAIQTFDDFQALPLITKDNYILHYALSARCRDGIESCDMLASSSGSTGKPTLWPRSLIHELQIATRFEQVFHDSFAADRNRTLAVICFALGTWVGGMYSASCCRYLAQKGYPLTVVTPGNHKAEILRMVTELGNSFEQIVLLGYPPFLKDVIDTGLADGVTWSQYQVKLVMAGEVFSEEWRDLLAERIGAQQPCYDFASLYGTADAGVLGHETPLSICIRRFLAANPAAARALFGESRLPTLVQYDPTSRFFEAQAGTLLFSGDSGVPLLRYNIKDTGGVISYRDMLEFLAEYGFDLRVELQGDLAREGGRGVRSLPFVYVFGRSDFTVSYFGANIYPENVTVGLEQPAIRDWVTGKFVMQVVEDADKNRFLQVVVELAPGETGSTQKAQALSASILAQLLRLNGEFASYVPPDYQQPRIVLSDAGDPDYFPTGIKHRYTRPS